ncbi:MAG: glycerophosphodiester phosphodiesterase family protein [Pseudomonadota bacterium]
MLIIGHRGAAGVRPENTLAGIEHAIECGVDWVEIDVREHREDLIVIHDDSYDRTTNGAGKIHDLTPLQRAALDAGDGERIPTLAEVVTLTTGRCGLNVELKDPGIVERVVALLDQHRALLKPAPCLSSFEQENLREIAKIGPDYPVGILGKDVAIIDNLIGELDAYSVNYSKTQVTSLRVEQAHQRGLRVFVYTVNDEQAYRRCEHLGVDGIFTDYPQAAINFFSRSG